MILRIIASRWADATETCRRFLYFSLSPQADGPLLTILSSASQMHNSHLSAPLRAQKTPACQRAAWKYPPPRMFFLTRMARNFRNCHPAHLDSADHRFAMADTTETFHLFLKSLTFAMRNRVASNKYAASIFSIIHWLSDYRFAIRHNSFTFPHNPFAFFLIIHLFSP